MSLLKVTPFTNIITLWREQNIIPLNIPIIDNTVGGLLPCYIHGVIGDSGVGKTIFCLRAINQVLLRKPTSKILYCNFEGHLRQEVVHKIISDPSKRNQIWYFTPNSLSELLIFFNDLQKRFDFIVIDTVFGAPVDSFNYFYRHALKWEKKIVMFLMNLRHKAKSWEIPILITNHLICSDAEFASFIPLNQSGGHLINPFVPIEFILSKNDNSHQINLRFFEQSLGEDSFTFVQAESTFNHQAPLKQEIGCQSRPEGVLFSK